MSESLSREPSIRFDGDVPVGAVPEKYRLGDFFVPKGRYLDVEYLKLELERVFPRTWQMACREQDLPGTGSFLEYRIHDTSILVVREGADTIRAYHNSCRHRGTRLAKGRGRVGSIICPFHGWRWNLDGSIKLMFDAEEFAERSEEDLGLQPVRVERWAGFVFINMDLDAEPLRDQLDPIPRVFEPFQLENMRYRWHKRVIVPCNWKTVLDGFLEAYHVPGTHPQLHRYDKANANPITPREIEANVRAWAPTTVYERTAKYQAVGKPKPAQGGDGLRTKEATQSFAAGASDPREAILNNVEYYFHELRALQTERSVRAAQALVGDELPAGVSAEQRFVELYRQLSLDEGYDWPQITARQWSEAGTSWHLFPNTIILPNQGSVLVYRSRPNGLDPDSSLFEMFALEQVPVADYDKRIDFEPEEVHADFRKADLGQVLAQDLDNAEAITAGMRSPSFEGHHLSRDQEATVYNHHRVADRYIWGR